MSSRSSSPLYEVHISRRSSEKTSSNFGYYVTKGDAGNLSRISLILSCNFENNTFLSGATVSVNKQR